MSRMKSWVYRYQGDFVSRLLKKAVNSLMEMQDFVLGKAVLFNDCSNFIRGDATVFEFSTSIQLRPAPFFTLFSFIFSLMSPTSIHFLCNAYMLDINT
ncbi:hypothetical protein H5410_043405 [Solanum commersonii]|uniref:Uncharacterized protein n=1 Tax=Solanum commersonii TaxID=4109 RepID=A0A9J5XX29_SOLCO|nr:hypothetical protein H5410_043405 [Solanum commersonii]